MHFWLILIDLPGAPVIQGLGICAIVALLEVIIKMIQ